MEGEARAAVGRNAGVVDLSEVERVGAGNAREPSLEPLRVGVGSSPYREPRLAEHVAGRKRMTDRLGDDPHVDRGRPVGLGLGARADSNCAAKERGVGESSEAMVDVAALAPHVTVLACAVRVPAPAMFAHRGLKRSARKVGRAGLAHAAVGECELVTGRAELALVQSRVGHDGVVCASPRSNADEVSLSRVTDKAVHAMGGRADHAIVRCARGVAAATERLGVRLILRLKERVAPARGVRALSPLNSYRFVAPGAVRGRPFDGNRSAALGEERAVPRPGGPLPAGCPCNCQRTPRRKDRPDVSRASPHIAHDSRPRFGPLGGLAVSRAYRQIPVCRGNLLLGWIRAHSLSSLPETTTKSSSVTRT